MEGTDLYRIVRKGFSEKVTIEKHPEQCKGMTQRRSKGVILNDMSKKEQYG